MTLGESLPHSLVCLVSLGMGLGFLLADRDSPTSRALSLTMLATGVSIFLNVVAPVHWFVPVWLSGLFAVPEAVAMIALLEWILRVRRTVPSDELNVRAGDNLLRAGQVLALGYSLLAIAMPQPRRDEFIGALSSVDAALSFNFWLFMAPVLGVALCAFVSMALLLRRKPDMPERLRVIGLMAAIPWMGAGFVLPTEMSSLAMIVGLMVFLIGALQYHVMQGQRGQFMSQFLSPQVADMVRRRGLRSAMKENFLEVSVVYVDLRGYTAVAEGAASSRVMRILRDYYACVGAVVAEYGATIKDQAGDGILILMGAPLEIPDHAQRALSMARRLRTEAEGLIRVWSQEGIWLGVGVGVASGHVTVGVIGAGARLEYSAVGSCVNLASRLCQSAADGEVLVSERTVELAGLQSARMGLQVRSPARFKGFSEPVGYFSLAPSA